MAKLRIGINGLGRIGRLALQHAVRRKLEPGAPEQVRSGVDIEVVAANDIADINQLVYLLSHDSVHRWRGPKPEADGSKIHFGPFDIQLYAERDPSKIPWAEHNVDIVLECTGRFTKRAGMEQHLGAQGGPRHVVLGAPGETDRTIVVGVNEDAIDRENDKLVSNASCTTNAISPVLGVIDRAFGVRWGLVSTIHAYTAGQGLVDGLGGKDLRRGRAAAVNLVPTSTGAARAVALVLPNLAGKLDGSAIRVPVTDGSMYEIYCTLEGSPELPRVLEALRDAAGTEALRGVMDVRDEALVSSDIVGDPHSSIVDVGTCLAQGPIIKIAGWYDNEYAYAARLLDLSTVLAG